MRSGDYICRAATGGKTSEQKKEKKEHKQKKAQKAEERRATLDNGNDEKSEEGSGTRILYKNTQNFQEIFEDPWVKCQFCTEKFDPHSILNHIGQNKDCKSFYGPKFDQFWRVRTTILTIFARNFELGGKFG